MNIHNQLYWRYATKHFDPKQKLTDEQVYVLLESMRLAPSSYGLQPWKFVVVNDTAIRKQLRDAAHNQPQVTDASHFIVLAVPREITPALVDVYMESIAQTRDVSLESLQGFSDMIKGTIANRSAEENRAWAVKQVYIALGMALATAAMEEIDTCAMEGFDQDAFDRMLGLVERGLTAVVALAAGVRDSEDPTAQRKKVRFSPQDVFIEI